MKNISFLLILVITYSCKNENKPFYMYGFLSSEFVQSTEIQKTQIAESLNNDKLIHDKSVKLYDSLTTKYLKYLENTSSKLINNIKKQQSNFDGEFSKNTYVNNFFFEGEKCNKTGNEFISKLKKYRTEILKLITNKNLIKKVDLVLNTDDIINQEGEEINCLKYIHKDLPLISVLTHMKYREKNIIEFENEFLKNRLLTE